jgi:drug/metabolite transporter (DMT)-like permease
VWLWLAGFDVQWRRWGMQYALVGLLNTGFPFLLYAYAALQMSAGQMAVLNATSPMWGALMSAIVLRERLSPGRILGLALGVAGVALITRPAGADFALMPVAACLGATWCYAFTGVYLRRWAPNAPAKGLAVGSQIAAGLIMLPLVALAPPAAAPTLLIVGCLLALGLVCGAIAYFMYFRLIADLGATGALTVTYVTPVFGMLWGALFLGETLNAWMLAGAALVIAGTVLVLRS